MHNGNVACFRFFSTNAKKFSQIPLNYLCKSVDDYSYMIAASAFLQLRPVSYIARRRCISG